MDQHFDKWYMEEQTLSGVLNLKVTKAKNADFRLKIDAWKKRQKERDRMKKRTFEHGGSIRAAFEKFSNNFDLGRERIQDAQCEYINLVEDLEKTRKEEKTINNMLALLPDIVTVIEGQNIDKIVGDLTNAWNREFKVLESFVALVKQELVLEKHYFNFYEVPELMVKRKFQKKDFENVKKLLLKV